MQALAGIDEHAESHAGACWLNSETHASVGVEDVAEPPEVAATQVDPYADTLAASPLTVTGIPSLFKHYNPPFNRTHILLIVW